MTRSRFVLFSSLVVVTVGVMVAVGALYLNPARAAVGPLPAEGLVLPADTRFIVGLDVRRFTASPFYKKYASAAAQAKARPEAFRELEEKTGLNPERDVDQILIAGREGSGKDSALILVRGRFDRAKLSRAIETEKKDKVTRKSLQGTTVYLFNEGSKGPGAVTFLGDDTLLIGSQPAVESTIASHAKGGQPLRGNAALLGLLERVRPGSTFWMVGDQTLLKSLPAAIPGAGASPAAGPGLALPALKSLTVTGDLDPAVAVEVTGEASDEAAAKNLADMVRGLVALGALQAGQKPELKELTSAISVTTDATRVRVNARFSYELLDSLQAKKPTPTPQASR